jgi:anti-sigma factor RsiW
MPNLLQQLENNEVVLLMYLADELPAVDRAEVEQMLAGDASLREKLEELRAAHTAVLNAVQELDRQSPPLSEAAAVRQVSRAMRQWQIDHFSQKQDISPKRGLRYPWWLYPLASAAAIVLAVMIWWGMKSDAPQQLARTPDGVVDDEDPAIRIVVSLQNQEDNGPGMLDAEQQASALKSRSDEGSQLSSILMTDSAPVN